MEPGSRTHQEQESNVLNDFAGTGVQRDKPGSQDNIGGTDPFTSQRLGQSGDECSVGGGQAGTGPGGVDIQSDRYTTPGQYGGPDRATTDQTAQAGIGYADPRIAGAGGKSCGKQPDDDEYSAGGGPTGKPPMTSRVQGAAEKLAGKITGDPGKQVRGREREEGTF